MRLTIPGTDCTINVDRKYASMLPKSLWTVTTRNGTVQPTGRLNGVTMTVVRMVGLLSGMPDCAFIMPKNGDYFDCRLKNVQACDGRPKPRPRKPVNGDKVKVFLNGKVVSLSARHHNAIVRLLTA
jgi:hypothetical protein